jgi:hypothetical protein
VQDLFARQVFGQRPPSRLVALLKGRLDDLRDGWHSGNALSIVLLERLDCELELLNRTLDLLRGLTKLSALEAGKLEA